MFYLSLVGVSLLKKGRLYAGPDEGGGGGGVELITE